jgi:dodecin
LQSAAPTAVTCTNVFSRIIARRGRLPTTLYAARFSTYLRDRPPRGPVGRRGSAMSNHTYRVSEIVGSSPNSIDEAMHNGLERAGKTLRHMDWFEVEGIRGRLEDGRVAHVQVTMKVGFRLEDPLAPAGE